MNIDFFLPEKTYNLSEILVDVKVDEKARVWINGVESHARLVPLEYGKNRIEIDVKGKDFKKIEHWILNLKKEEHEFELQDGYIFLMEILDAFKVKTEWIPREKTINLFLGEDVYSITIGKETLVHNNQEEACEPVIIIHDKAMITPKTAGLFGSVSEFHGKAKITRFS